MSYYREPYIRPKVNGEDMDKLDQAYGMRDLTMFCGYLRQPISARPGRDHVTIMGTCALNDHGCQYRAERATPMTCEDCVLYQGRFGVSRRQDS